MCTDADKLTLLTLLYLPNCIIYPLSYDLQETTCLFFFFRMNFKFYSSKSLVTSLCKPIYIQRLITLKIPYTPLLNSSLKPELKSTLHASPPPCTQQIELVSYLLINEFLQNGNRHQLLPISNIIPYPPYSIDSSLKGVSYAENTLLIITPTRDYPHHFRPTICESITQNTFYEMFPQLRSIRTFEK